MAKGGASEVSLQQPTVDGCNPDKVDCTLVPIDLSELPYPLGVLSELGRKIWPWRSRPGSNLGRKDTDMF